MRELEKTELKVIAYYPLLAGLSIEIIDIDHDDDIICYRFSGDDKLYHTYLQVGVDGDYYLNIGTESYNISDFIRVE